MSSDVLTVKSTVSGGPEMYFGRGEINGYNLVTDVPVLAIPALSAWVKGKGYSTDFFDLDKYPISDLLKKTENTERIGFYLNYSSTERVNDAVNALKKEYPDKTIIIGGPSTSSLQEKTFKLIPNADIVVYGEGEIPLETILSESIPSLKIMIRENNEAANGIILHEGETIYKAKKPGIVKDLSELPIPDYSFFEKGYLPIDFIETSRGCAYKCPFCATSGLFPTRRLKSYEQLKSEINALNPKYLVFTDPALYPARRMDDISEVLMGKGITWTGYAKPGVWGSDKPFYTLETLVKAKENGCVSLFFGGESGSEITQELYGKPKHEVLIEMEKLCKKAGILSCWSWIILSPGETGSDVDKTIELIKKLNPAMVTLNSFFIDPNSDMDKHPEKYCLIIEDEEYNLKLPGFYSAFSKVAGPEAKEAMKKMLKESPESLRSMLKSKIKEVDFYESTKTHLGMADAVFEMLRANTELEETKIAVGRTNYHLMLEMAACGITNPYDIKWVKH